MTPIISPWILYAIEFVDKLTFFAGAFLLIYIMVGAFVFLAGDDEFEPINKILRKIFPLFVIATVVIIFTPSSETITKMLVAQNVTYERVEVAADTVERVYEDIIGLFEDKDDSDA